MEELLEVVYYEQSVQMLYKGATVFTRVVLFIAVESWLVAAAESWGEFGNPEEVESPELGAVTRKLMKIVTEDTCLCVKVVCKM
jgi:hypothetical protein